MFLRRTVESPSFGLLFTIDCEISPFLCFSFYLGKKKDKTISKHVSNGCLIFSNVAVIQG